MASSSWRLRAFSVSQCLQRQHAHAEGRHGHGLSVGRERAGLCGRPTLRGQHRPPLARTAWRRVASHARTHARTASSSRRRSCWAAWTASATGAAPCSGPPGASWRAPAQGLRWHARSARAVREHGTLHVGTLSRGPTCRLLRSSVPSKARRAHDHTETREGPHTRATHAHRVLGVGGPQRVLEAVHPLLAQHAHPLLGLRARAPRRPSNSHRHHPAAVRAPPAAWVRRGQGLRPLQAPASPPWACRRRGKTCASPTRCQSTCQASASAAGAP